MKEKNGIYVPQNQEKNLLTFMEQCGHFIFHRRGGKGGQNRVLRLLTHHGQLTQRELQEMLNLSSGSMSEIITKMEQSGYIARAIDEADRRKKVIQITEAGASAYREMQRLEQEDDLFCVLQPEEQAELARLMETLLNDWKSRARENKTTSSRG